MTTQKKPIQIPHKFTTLCGRVFRDTDPQYFPRVGYRGCIIYFCTESCLNAFLSDPDLFHKTHGPPNKSHGLWEK